MHCLQLNKPPLVFPLETILNLQTNCCTKETFNEFNIRWRKVFVNLNFANANFQIICTFSLSLFIIYHYSKRFSLKTYSLSLKNRIVFKPISDVFFKYGCNRFQINLEAGDY